MNQWQARKMMCVCVGVFMVGLLTSTRASAEVRLPKVFGSHMVLQREKPVPVWGWAQPGEAVTVQFQDEKKETKANNRGEWRVDLPGMKAGGPCTLTIAGQNAIKYEDVMVGEVWMCSGQSNMEMGIGACLNASQEIAAANYPGLRLLMVPNKWSELPELDADLTWKVCTPATVAEGGWGGFSATAYYFGREIHKTFNVPVGLIDTDWGGTLIEPWTPPEGFAAVPSLKPIYDRVLLADRRTASHKERLAQVLKETEAWLAAVRKAMTEGIKAPPMPTYPAELLPPQNHQSATALYNAMIYPLKPYAIRGALWYQGESNHGEGMLYADKMKALIEGWRQLWGEGEFPFYFVQIAPFNYGTENPTVLAEFWEAQIAAASAIPNSGIAITNDITDYNDIHPRNKQEVGRRLALLALAKTYGRKETVCSGPTFKSMGTEGSKLRLTFDNIGGGLASRDGKPLTWFEIIDADEGGFVKAEASIEGNAVILSAPNVKRPVAVRFAWDKSAEPNLMNKEGLPAPPFRAGTVPKRDLLAINVPEAKDYQLVYDLDLAKVSGAVQYDIDNRAKINRPFDRIAYFVEVQVASGETQFIYVSMDAFTDDLGKIGVPTVESKATFQQNVTNMNVLSNVKAIVAGTGLQGGNLEFWPNNYGPANAKGVPNASSEVWDFGDQIADPVNGYGCMQVHNHDAKQTLFAFNHWTAGQGADLGIGNSPNGNPDWTFVANARAYLPKRLRVLVRCK